MTLKNIFLENRYRISITLLIVLIEGLLFVLYPLFIGRAIDAGIEGDYSGVLVLTILFFLSLLIGSLRRFYDTRVYARIYQKLAAKVAAGGQSGKQSETIAHVNLLGEVVVFLENSVPQLLMSAVGLIGTLLIVSSLDTQIFFACLLSIVLIYFVYRKTAGKTMRLNGGYNSEYERQVSIHQQEAMEPKTRHYSRLMRWKVRLSDLETVNFSIVWLILASLLAFAIVTMIGSEHAVVGMVFSTIMYVFQFMESTINLPYYYQEVLRLKDISTRIENTLNPLS